MAWPIPGKQRTSSTPVVRVRFRKTNTFFSASIIIKKKFAIMSHLSRRLSSNSRTSRTSYRSYRSSRMSLPTPRSLFDNLWGRFKSAIGWTTQGYSRQHAKQIYRSVYGGVADLLEVSPEELGAAAGYEAIRLWEYQHNQYQMPLNPDLEREREALAGLAIAEGTYAPQSSLGY
jgi:hypothetical protein